MRKFLLGVLLALCAAAVGHAQATTAVSSSSIQGLNGAFLVSGSLCFQATDQNDQNIGIQVSGGGTVVSTPFCTAVTNGAISTFNVPNPATATPGNTRYRIYVTQGSRPIARFPLSYLCNQAGACTAPYTFNFDNCLSSGACIANPIPIVTGPAGVPGPPGLGCNFRATYSSGTTYALSDCVLYSGSYYISLIGSNIGNTPSSSPSDWQPISSVPCSTVTGALQINSSGVFGCAAGLTTPDNGNSVNIKGPVPWIDATQYGVRALTIQPNTITVTSPGSSPTVSTTGVSDFQKNDGIVIPQAGGTTSQSTPSAPTVTPIGATGSITVNYKCVGVDAHWGLTAASAAGTTTTAPTVFGVQAVGITSIARASNVVTVTASSTMAFNTGTFHAVIANVTGGTTQFSGLQLVTVTSGTTLTYSQTGANESGTTSSASYILFENAFVLTTVQATSGSNQLVLTTDVNHNIAFVSSGTRPTRIFLDGINFSAATPPAYANGPTVVAAVTSNTITVNTPYTSPITTTGAASSSFATSAVAQMTATVYPVIDVACPAIAGTTKYYAIYANYGSGYVPIGFTHWLTTTFEDYGPAFTKTGFVAPPAMNLPAAAPASAQNQPFSGQIASIVGSTLTLTTSVPTAVTSVTAYHDNGVPLQNAVAQSCSNGGGGSSNSQGFAPVYLPRQALGGASQFMYYFAAPTDLSGSCNRVNIVDGGPVYLDGTLFGDGIGEWDWLRAKDTAGYTNFSNDVGGEVNMYGRASPMMVPGISGARIEGMSIDPLSNGEDGIVFIGTNALFQDDGYVTSSIPGLTTMPLVFNTPNGFQNVLERSYFSGDRSIQYPIPQSGQNIETGQVAWWPVPVVDILGPQFPVIKIVGQNYGNVRGVQLDNLYGNGGSPAEFVLSDMQTNQDPWQPFVQIYGVNGGRIPRLDITRTQEDSVQMPAVACEALSPCIILYTADSALTQSDGNDPSFTGTPSNAAFEFLAHSAAPAQNANEVSINGGTFSSTLPPPNSSFANLLACSSTTKGLNAIVTDSNTTTWGANIAGSSTNVVLAFCDGTNWTVAGK